MGVEDTATIVILIARQSDVLSLPNIRTHDYAMNRPAPWVGPPLFCTMQDVSADDGVTQLPSAGKINAMNGSTSPEPNCASDTYIRDHINLKVRT